MKDKPAAAGFLFTGNDFMKRLFFVLVSLLFLSSCSIEAARKERLDLLMNDVRVDRDKYIECMYKESVAMAFYREEPYVIASAAESRCALAFASFSKKTYEYFKEQQRGDAIKAKIFSDMTTGDIKKSNRDFSIETVIKKRNE